MPIKSTKSTIKSDSKFEKALKKNQSESNPKKTEDKKNTTKRVIVKRRKVDLVPTRASAVAIASQANRAKKQALIEKVESWESKQSRIINKDDTKIPLWVWMFFWCSLLLFCVSFYQAIFRPQLDKKREVLEKKDISWIDSEDTNENLYQEVENIVDETNIQTESGNEDNLEVPETATEVIEEFFVRLSNRNFDEAFDLLIPALRSSSEIQQHFTPFRMIPFLDWIEWWKLIPSNFQYVSSPDYWKDRYNFDLSYVLISDQSNYDEIWEFTVNTKWSEPKISSIRCVTSKCSYHPIFWPENFGLMR